MSKKNEFAFIHIAQMHMSSLVLIVADPDPGSGAFFDDVTTKPVLWSREPRPKLNCLLEPELRIVAPAPFYLSQT
jgi:hypothetical protein